MSEPIRLTFGQTPWDNLSREELLREVQRYHSALTSASSVLRQCALDSPHPFWREGPGGKAIEKADQVKARLDGFNSESVYRSFFRYADDLLFKGQGDVWMACDQCEALWTQMGPVEPGPRFCNDCKRKGVESLLRPITWDDLKPKGEAMTDQICQDPRAGGPHNDWRDTPCGKPATAEHAGRPVCQDHYEAAERREIEAIAEHFFDGVPIEDLRRIADAGGLKPMLAGYLKLVSFLQDVPTDRLVEIDAAGGLRELLASHAQLIEASAVALPHLARHFTEGYTAVVGAYNDATPFWPEGTR